MMQEASKRRCNKIKFMSLSFVSKMPFILFQLFCCSKDKDTSLVYCVCSRDLPLNALRQLVNAGGIIVFKDQTWALLHVCNYSLLCNARINISIIYFVT